MDIHVKDKPFIFYIRKVLLIRKVDDLKKKKIEDMPIRITYSNKTIDKEKLYSIFCDIIDREMNKENNEEGEENEKKCVLNES